MNLRKMLLNSIFTFRYKKIPKYIDIDILNEMGVTLSSNPDKSFEKITLKNGTVIYINYLTLVENYSINQIKKLIIMISDNDFIINIIENQKIKDNTLLQKQRDKIIDSIIY